MLFLETEARDSNVEKERPESQISLSLALNDFRSRKRKGRLFFMRKKQGRVLEFDC